MELVQWAILCRNAVHAVSFFYKTIVQEPKDAAYNHWSIQCNKMVHKDEMSVQLKDSFAVGVPLVIHWDCKLESDIYEQSCTRNRSVQQPIECARISQEERRQWLMQLTRCVLRQFLWVSSYKSWRGAIENLCNNNKAHLSISVTTVRTLFTYTQNSYWECWWLPSTFSYNAFWRICINALYKWPYTQLCSNRQIGTAGQHCHSLKKNIKQLHKTRQQCFIS